MVVMVQGKQQKCSGGGGCEEKQSKCGGSGGGGGGGKTIEMWCWRENNRKVEVMVHEGETIDMYYANTVNPYQYGHQRDRTKCPLYRGVRIIEVGNV